MTIAQFKKRHPVGNWCRPMTKPSKTPVLKFGRLDVPEAVDNRCYCTPVEDQGARPWCAAYTAAAFAENVLWRRDGRISEIEPEPIYRWAKQHDGDPDGDGTTLDCVLDALLAKGVFDKDCKVRRVGTSWTGIDCMDAKQAVHRFGCFLAGFNVTEEWYELARAGRTEITGERGASQGGHAVLVCGYNNDGVWIENSWGKGWGADGFALVCWGAFRSQFLYGTVLTNCLNGFK